MIIDMCSFFGKWGIRTKGIDDVEIFLERMDKNNIKISVVTGTIALVTDTYEGNLYLLEKIKSYKERLIPVVCINPIWGEKECKYFFDNYEFEFVRISPALHNYSLKDDLLIKPIMEIFKKNNVVIYITSEICYQFSSLSYKIGYYPPIYPVDEIIKFSEKYPEQKMIISGYPCESLNEIEKTIIPSLKENKNLFFEISNIIVPVVIETLAEEVPDKILLGTGNAIVYPEGSINKVLCAKISAEIKEKILFKNAQNLLKGVLNE